MFPTVWCAPARTIAGAHRPWQSLFPRLAGGIRRVRAFFASHRPVNRTHLGLSIELNTFNPPPLKDRIPIVLTR